MRAAEFDQLCSCSPRFGLHCKSSWVSGHYLPTFLRLPITRIMLLMGSLYIYNNQLPLAASIQSSAFESKTYFRAGRSCQGTG